MINQYNYESYLFLYQEGELDDAERKLRPYACRHRRASRPQNTPHCTPVALGRSSMYCICVGIWNMGNNVNHYRNRQ